MNNSLFNHIHFEEIDSTSAYLKREYNKLNNFTFVSAGFQTNGKGRETRQWISEKNTNLLFSLLIKDKKLIQHYGSLSLATAASIASYLKRKGIKGVSIKWPNDIYINGKKVCGILLEGNVEEYLVIGIGLNVNQSEFPNGLHHPASSLLNETGHHYLLEVIRDEIFENLFNDLNFKKIQEKHYLNVVNELNYLKDLEVYIDGKKAKVLRINENNSLSVLLDGEKKSIISGEIEFHE